MLAVPEALARVSEDASAATVYFHTWWALRNLAVPEYLSTMNNTAYIDFFHASNSGFLKLTFISLAKLFDSDDRALGIRGLRRVLEASGYSREAKAIEQRFAPHTDLVTRVLGTRSRSVAHNEAAISRDQVYETYGVTPDEIRDLVSEVRNTVNELSQAIGSLNSISEGARSERAVLAMLEQLKRGGSAT